MIRLIVVLALITFMAALALGFVYQSAAPKIEAQKRMTDEVARRTALPEAACGVFVERERDGFTYYEGYRRADTTGFVGYVVKAAGRGYSSTIETMVGVGPDGKVKGLKITHQQETPGLGTKIEEVTSSKTVLDAIMELAGQGRAQTVAVDVEDTLGALRCVEVELLDHPLCAEIESLVIRSDTSGVMGLAPEAFRLPTEDSLAFFCSPPLAFEISDKVIEKLRKQVTPWFLAQFVGKTYGSLLITAGENDRYIQAITGATISSAAVTESVRGAIMELEKAVGGFQEGES
jgi:Na+-translocating ferredoxin:NAD+ oxidoreductase RnfG subunit